MSRALLSFLGLVGCAGTAEGVAKEDEVASAARARPNAPAVAIVAPDEQTIFDIRKPESTIPAGKAVRLSHPALRVTASTATRVWIQDAADSGSCEIGTAEVAWHAIVVVPKADASALVPGQRVVVEGIVEGEGAKRTLREATIRPVERALEPLVAHCERDGWALADASLDAVLVMTAGTTKGRLSPGSDGTWTLAPCFGAAKTISIGSEMVEHEEWEPTWHWVIGVVDQNGGTTTLQPRDSEDIFVHGHDDACL